jgi:hypothetical protein
MDPGSLIFIRAGKSGVTMGRRHPDAPLLRGRRWIAALRSQ